MNPKAEKGIGCSKTQLQGFTFIEILNPFRCNYVLE